MNNDRLKKAVGIIRIINAVLKAIASVFKRKKKNDNEATTD